MCSERDRPKKIAVKNHVKTVRLAPEEYDRLQFMSEMAGCAEAEVIRRALQYYYGLFILED